MTGSALALTVFCCVSGGPFGLEPLVSGAGPGLALLLILVIPLVWALPDAMTTAELAPAIPVEGGYVVWVRRAMGPLAGFLNAWWTWIYTLVDAAIYPVLFATYLSGFLKATNGISWLDREEHPLHHWLVCVVVVGLFTLLNVKGTRLVGRTSSLFAAVIIVPFLVMAVVGLIRLGMHPRPIVSSFFPQDTSPSKALAAGLSVVMWNYLGWDALSTIAEEVDEPAKAYPRAMLLGVPLVASVYFFPTLAGLAFFPTVDAWQEGAWPEIARAVGGSALWWAVSISGLVSPIALFTASLLGSSRVPFVLAEERFLPKALVSIHPRFGTPWKAVLLCGLIYAVLTWQKFQDLVELNVIMYGAALVLESAALLVLRWREPDLPRPFKIPGGWPVLALTFFLPVAVVATLVVLSIQEEGWASMRLTGAALASGPIIYFCVRTWQGRRGAKDFGIGGPIS